MKSMPAASAMRASCRHSGQLADQRSGTLVAERPDEQFAPKMPIFSTLPLYMASRSCIAAVRASKALLRASHSKSPRHHGTMGENGSCGIWMIKYIDLLLAN